MQTIALDKGNTNGVSAVKGSHRLQIDCLYYPKEGMSILTRPLELATIFNFQSSIFN